MNIAERGFTVPFVSEYCCRNDAALTLIGDTVGLARLLGYTKDELPPLFGNSLTAMATAEGRHVLQNALADTADIECVFSARHKSGNTVCLLNRAVRQTGEDGNEYIYGVLVEINKLKQAYDYEKNISQALEEEAKKDSLTHIYNAYNTRKLAEAYLAEPLQNTATLLIIDLDDFKQINDTHGHMFGDAVLVQTAKIIKKLFRSEDIVGRIGGEEFMVLMKGTADLTIIQNRCLRLNELLMTMFGNNDPVCKPSCSIGVALFPQHAASYFDLFRCADRALYYAKEHGKQRHALYDESNLSMTGGGYSLRHADYDEKTLRGYIDFD